jgi:hypothetical protein
VRVHKTRTTSLQNKFLENSYLLLKRNAFDISTTGIFNNIPSLKLYDKYLVNSAKNILLERINQFKHIDTLAGY